VSSRLVGSSRPLWHSPVNHREYLHKPYTARNYVPWATFFVADSTWVALQIFEQFCPKTGDVNPLVAEPETDFDTKLPFKVTYFGIIEEPLRGYIAQYNKCGLSYEGSDDIASERSENHHFRQPYYHLTLQRTPANIRIKLTLLETRILGLQYGSIFIQILVVGSDVNIWIFEYLTTALVDKLHVCACNKKLHVCGGIKLRVASTKSRSCRPVAQSRF